MLLMMLRRRYDASVEWRMRSRSRTSIYFGTCLREHTVQSTGQDLQYAFVAGHFAENDLIDIHDHFRREKQGS
jgi:hypothetical protein